MAGRGCGELFQIPQPSPSYPGPGNASFGANGGVYNRNGRGIPDVSANGDNIAVFLEGNFTINGGTSASTPIFASIITLVSDSVRSVLCFAREQVVYERQR
jgi:hypothetical protein